jgi:hypothetical protein
MTKIVNWGRWVVAGLLAGQGLAGLPSTLKETITTIRSGQGTLYPTYMHILGATTFLLCAWGLLKVHRWAYWLAVLIYAFEVIILFSVVAMWGPETIATDIFIGGLHFDSVTLLLPVVAAIACFVWLLLPSVRAQYMQKESAA